MSLLPSQVGLIRPRLEVAFGADVSSPADWVWTDVTDRETAGSRARLLSQTVAVTRGRADQSSAVQPTTATFTLDNPDGALTPDNPASIWYEDWDVGTPCRFSIFAGSPYLALSGNAGSRAGTPDHADLDITGDWTLIWELWAPVLVPPPALNYELSGKFNVTGNQRSIVGFLDGAALLRLRWSTDGTGAGEQNSNSSEPIPLPEAGPLTIAAGLDVNNGAGGRTTHFYACPGELADFLADPAAFELGDPDTDAGTTSVFPSTAPLDIGDVTGSGFAPYPGQVRRFQARAGDPFTGAVRANPDFTTLEPGDTSLVDSAGRTWTVQGDAEVTNVQPVLTGQVDEILPTWPHGDLSNGDNLGEARVTVTASGILRRLSQGQKALDSALSRMITAPINASLVYGYWPAEDGRGSATAYSPIAGVRHGVVRMTYAVDDTLASSRPLPQSSQTYGYAFAVPANVPTTAWEATCFVRIPTAPTSEIPLLRVDANSQQSARWSIDINDTVVRLRISDPDGTVTVNQTVGSDARMFDTWMIVRLATVQNGGNVDWDIDLIPIPLGVVFGLNNSFSGTLGRPTRLHTPTYSGAPPDGISFGHFIVTSGTVPGWLAPADTAFVGEPATSRFYRLCGEADIPVTINGLHSTDWGTVVGVEKMGPQRPLPFLDLIQECAAVDMGILSEHRHQLGLHYRARVTLENQAPALILDAAGSEIANPFGPSRDDRARRNDITVARVDGSSARVTTDPPPASGDLYAIDVGVNVATDLQLPDQAGWRLHLGTWPGMRYANISTELTIAPDVIDPWLRLKLGDRIQVVGMPPQHPADVVDLLIEGEATAISPQRWTPQLNCSPAGAWDVGVRDDAERGKRDTAGSELAATFGAGTDTSMSVATTNGPLWTTTGAEFPFDIAVSGARLTVTAISGASSPQTFTVTPTPVNGVTKTIAAGTPVRLWRPTVRAL